ncbi:AAA family ATPase [Pseudonocardia sp. H11422]|uniref:AAA family ATPase n=1 Tax=Pseudonocardia sp. H11422 TaxID=2835866 RepID=UPI003977AAAE
MLELLVGDNGAFELIEIHRFANEWERDASIRLRAGDKTVLDLYEDHGRLHGGTAGEMAAFGRGWPSLRRARKRCWSYGTTRRPPSCLSRSAPSWFGSGGWTGPEWSPPGRPTGCGTATP